VANGWLEDQEQLFFLYQNTYFEQMPDQMHISYRRLLWLTVTGCKLFEWHSYWTSGLTSNHSNVEILSLL